MNKMKLNIEMLLPTMITKEVDFPLYLHSKKDHSYVMIKDSESTDTYFEFDKIEIKKFSDGEIIMYKFSLSADQLKKIVASIDREFTQIEKEDFLFMFDNYKNQIEELYNSINKF